MRTKSGWWIILGCAAMGGVAVVWQQHAMTVLRVEIGAQQQGIRTTRRLRAENERLRAMSASSEPAPIAVDDTTLQQARTETATLRQQVMQMTQMAWPSKRTPTGRFGADSKVPASEWRNAGAGTPQAALETVLWAAAGGDVDTFANNLLLLGAPSQAAAQALFDGLPAETRGRYRSPVQLIAALTIPEIPIGQVQVIDWQDWQREKPWWAVRAVLAAPDGSQKKIAVWIAPSGDAWKLVVTDAVVAKLAAQLKGQVTVPGGK